MFLIKGLVSSYNFRHLEGCITIGLEFSRLLGENSTFALLLLILS
jgi:hypothetical protein